jgi:two-component system, sensor histidine kinase LadS
MADELAVLLLRWLAMNLLTQRFFIDLTTRLLWALILCIGFYAQGNAQATPLSPCEVTAQEARVQMYPCSQPLSEAQGQALMQQLASELRFDTPLRWNRFDLQVGGQQSLERILTLGVPNTMELLVLQTHANQTRVLARLERHADFDQRPQPTPRLQMPITLAPGEHTLHIAYMTYARGAIVPELLSVRESSWQTTLGNLSNGLAVGIMLTLCVGILVYRFVGGPLAYMAYVGLVLSEVSMLLQIEGYGFAFLWPHSPVWNQAITPVFASCVLASHAVFAMSFLQLRERSRMLYLVHVWCIAIAAAHVLWTLFAKVYVNVSLSVALCTALYAFLATWTAYIALRKRWPGAPLYFLGAASLVSFGFVLFPMGVVGLNPFPFINFFLYPKIGILLEAAFFSAALVNRVVQFREQQAQERMQRLAEAEQLMQSEHAKQQALALAKHHSLQLASASHDMAQPLASLRFAVAALKSKAQSDPIANHLDQTLEYTESLLKDLVLRSREEMQQESMQSGQVHLGQLLQSVATNYEQAAKDKKLSLRVMPSRAYVQGSALVIGRIVHNLLGNAVRHTQRGRIVVGVRYRAQGVELQVHDTGPGLLPAQVRRLMRAFTQGKGSQQGFGLGLFIVKSLCEQCGYPFRVQSQLGRGSCFSVLIPHRHEQNTVLTVSP